MSTTSVFVPSSYSIYHVGSLTTLWTPPSSCLYTTTSYSGQLFQGGYIPAIGTDNACYPPESEKVQIGLPVGKFGTTTTAPVPTTVLTARQIFDNSINLYSPGICPSGWDYVASFVTTPVEAAPTSGLFTYSEPWMTGTGVNTYFCCPNGFELNVATSSPFPTMLMNYMSCTFITSSYLENVFNLEYSTSWPTSLPTPLPIYTTEINEDDSGQASCTTFTITASGIAVAWAPTDTAVMELLLNGTFEGEEAVWEGIPGFPPQWPTLAEPYPGCGPGSPAWLLATILPSVIIGVGILLCYGCCCWAAHKNRRKRATLGLPTQRFGRRQEPGEDQIPLKNVSRAHMADHSGGAHDGRAFEPMRTLDEEGLPTYDETLMMDDSNLDACNTMVHDVLSAGRLEGD